METAREKFEELVRRVDLYLRAERQENLLRGLEVYRTAARHGDEKLAAHSFDKLLVFCQGWGRDIELVPYVEEAREWCRITGIKSFHA